MKTNQRREFLKKSILGFSGAALISGPLKSSTLLQEPKNELPLRALGKTGINIPVLSMGTGDTNNPALIKGALENGVVLFGTSAYYGNGNNESMLGNLFKTLPRKSFMVATSAMPKGTDHQKGLFTDATAAASFIAEIEAGMKRLNVDYLDILFLPFAAKRESVFFEPLLRAMEDFKKAGKTRLIGIATHSYIDQAIIAAADTKIYDVVMPAYNFKMQTPQPVEDAIAYGAKAGLGVIAMKSMAGGYWDKERTQPISSSPALKWVLKNENIHSIMSGMTTFQELQGNLILAKNPGMTEQEMMDLKLASSQQKGLFCLQCRECDGQCIHNLDIPTAMRSYMYAYGYRNMHHARQTVDMVTNASVCDSCDACQVQCTAGFDVKKKMQDITRLKSVPEDFLG
jgi:predicted aldo/keto reductase-like oxidoreductase